jgi:hypothetical protein
LASLLTLGESVRAENAAAVDPVETLPAIEVSAAVIPEEPAKERHVATICASHRRLWRDARRLFADFIAQIRRGSDQCPASHHFLVDWVFGVGRRPRRLSRRSADLRGIAGAVTFADRHRNSAPNDANGTALYFRGQQRSKGSRERDSREFINVRGGVATSSRSVAHSALNK